jgi:prepilin-type N-terminal cleavage/methylation domain-containing protein/prepilin-type processing-associated H-X9-DG protein
MRRRQGFTLIELLVVMSIIALLVAILAPALSKVKEQARNVICSVHQKELTLAWRMYTVSNNGELCSSYVYSDGSSTEGAFSYLWEDTSSWVWVPWDSRKNKPAIESPPTSISSFSDVSKEEKIEGVKRGALWPYLGDHEIYRCNSDRSRYQHIRSYSIVDSMNGKYADISADDEADWRIFNKISEVPRPSESYVFVEGNDQAPYNIDSFLINVKGYDWWDPLAVWHKGASSFSFADGHVEQRHWSDETVSEFSLADEGAYGPWNPVTAGGIDDFNWMQAGWAR